MDGSRVAGARSGVTITLFDLAGADPALRFSPYCWRTRLALAHKELPVETLPWRLADKQTIAFSGQGRVPVIRDGGRVVFDSWTIAAYLEETYPERPSLFGGLAGQAHARFINAWADIALNAAISRMVVHDVWRALDPGDQPYFRESREARFGMTLEQTVEGRAERVEEFRRLLSPLRTMLRAQPWIGGAAPSYADYIVAGSLQWARCICPLDLLEPEDEVVLWRSRVGGLFDSLAGAAPRV